MINILKGVWFCSSKNYTSTFKIRSRLSQFFKHVHPDQLAQAPTKVKQQNLRSLTNFNSYIDSISQGRYIEGKLLKFYIAEKNNAKSKKFFSFTVELPSITTKDGEMSDDKAKKLVDNIVDVLNKKFVESKNFRTKHGKTVQKIGDPGQGNIEDKQTNQQRFQRMSSTIKPFSKKNFSQQESQHLKNALNSKYMEAEKQSLATVLRKKITFANTDTRKSIIWERLASEKSGIYQDYQKIMDQLIDPKLIYFNEDLTMQQIDQFKKRLLPGNLDRQSYRNSKIIIQVCNKMQSFEPPICFYVSKKYSSTQIPGFLTIPFNFVPTELATFFQKQIDTVVAQQEKYVEFYDYYLDLKAVLQVQNNIYVEDTNFRNNNHIWYHILAMQRLKRYQLDKNTKLIIFENETFDVFRMKYQIRSNSTVVQFEGKIIIKSQFLDSDMEKLIQDIKLREII